MNTQLTKILIFAGMAGFLAWPNQALAQQQGDSDHEWCDEEYREDRRAERYCEVREFTMAAGQGTVRVDGGPNGGIEVEGWDGNEIRILAKVQVWSRDGDDPQELAGRITVETGDVISADGPSFRERGRRRSGWAVSYQLMVPHRTDLSLETVNGGIGIADVSGSIDFRAVNGGISLQGVGGDVEGRTTNGGIDVDLEGDEWTGAGLDVETTNGGITMSIPEDFRATLHTGTVNGGFEIDFPIVVQGRVDRRRLTTDLNGGGAPIRAVTTNGGVTVRRR